MTSNNFERIKLSAIVEIEKTALEELIKDGKPDDIIFDIIVKGESKYGTHYTTPEIKYVSNFKLENINTNKYSVKFK